MLTPRDFDSCIVDCAVYIGGERVPGHLSCAAALARVRQEPGAFCWVGLYAPDEGQMAGIAATFSLHELAVEDVVHAHQRPKLERYDDLYFLVLRTVSYVDHETVTRVSDIVDTGEIMVLMGPDFVITVRHGEHTELTGVRHVLEENPSRLALGPSAVLHAVADRVVDSYIGVTHLVERDVDASESTVFTPRGKVEIEPLYQLKKEIVEFRRCVNPLAGPLQQLVSPASGLPKEIRRYLRDVADHHTHVADEIADFDAAMSSMIDAALANVATQQNADLRKISALVAIVSAPTMIAAIYGMNFEHMPELVSLWGYPTVLTLMAAASALLFLLFRVKRWL